MIRALLILMLKANLRVLLAVQDAHRHTNSLIMLEDTYGGTICVSFVGNRPAWDDFVVGMANVGVEGFVNEARRPQGVAGEEGHGGDQSGERAPVS